MSLRGLEGSCQNMYEINAAGLGSAAASVIDEVIRVSDYSSTAEPYRVANVIRQK